MIKPTDRNISSPPVSIRTTIPSRPPADRPVVSLAAPQGNQAELSFHSQMVAAAEKEFARLLGQIEPLLQPLG